MALRLDSESLDIKPRRAVYLKNLGGVSGVAAATLLTMHGSPDVSSAILGVVDRIADGNLYAIAGLMHLTASGLTAAFAHKKGGLECAVGLAMIGNGFVYFGGAEQTGSSLPSALDPQTSAILYNIGNAFIMMSGAWAKEQVAKLLPKKAGASVAAEMDYTLQIEETFSGKLKSVRDFIWENPTVIGSSVGLVAPWPLIGFAFQSGDWMIGAVGACWLASSVLFGISGNVDGKRTNAPSLSL